MASVPLQSLSCRDTRRAALRGAAPLPALLLFMVVSGVPPLAAQEWPAWQSPASGGTVAWVTDESEAPAESAQDRAVRDVQTAPGAQESPLDRAVRELGLDPASVAPAPSAGVAPATAATGPAASAAAPQLRLVDISLDALFAAGASTERDAALLQLQGGGHDPRKRGFTVQNTEVSMLGAVDPYFDGEMHLIAFLDPIGGETAVELEEVFLTTRALPHGLQLKAGHFLTEFGRINPTHPHAWFWQDQPIINTRLFGPDGMRGPGVRMSWLIPVEWFSNVYVGMQNANGETMASFLANAEYFEVRPIAGRPYVERDVRSLGDMVHTARWENSWTTGCDEVTWLIGVSEANGPNATSPHGNTQVFGVDVTRKWRPAQNQRGWPFTVWTGEFMFRHYRAGRYYEARDPADPGDDVNLAPATLRDWGFYIQWLYGFRPRWACGLRYEYAWSTGDGVDADFAPLSRNADPFRDQRHRLSPLLAWYVTEFSRFRLQYNFDHAEHLAGKDAHSFWLGAEFMLGSHPAHKF